MMYNCGYKHIQTVFGRNSNEPQAKPLRRRPKGEVGARAWARAILEAGPNGPLPRASKQSRLGAGPAVSLSDAVMAAARASRPAAPRPVFATPSCERVAGRARQSACKDATVNGGAGGWGIVKTLTWSDIVVFFEPEQRMVSKAATGCR